MSARVVLLRLIPSWGSPGGGDAPIPAWPAAKVIAMSEPILRVQAALTGRDLVLLGWLADHGVLTTEQIAAALFPSVNFVQRRLRALLSMRVVDRFRPQRPDGGSYPYHWLLAQLGQRKAATGPTSTTPAFPAPDTAHTAATPHASTHRPSTPPLSRRSTTSTPTPPSSSPTRSAAPKTTTAQATPTVAPNSTPSKPRSPPRPALATATGPRSRTAPSTKPTPDPGSANSAPRPTP
jgi:Replication-relaxation